MLYDRVFVTGNRAVITLVARRTLSIPTKKKKKEKPRPTGSYGETGLVLHGSPACIEKANALLDIADQWISFKKTFGDSRTYYKRHDDHRLVIHDDELTMTIISSMGDCCRSTITLEGPTALLALAEQLFIAAEMIEKNEREMEIPVLSDWKQSAGAPMVAVRPHP